jgi:hypothetical protein
MRGAIPNHFLLNESQALLHIYLCAVSLTAADTEFEMMWTGSGRALFSGAVPSCMWTKENHE